MKREIFLIVFCLGIFVIQAQEENTTKKQQAFSNNSVQIVETKENTEKAVPSTKTIENKVQSPAQPLINPSNNQVPATSSKRKIDE